MVAVALAVKLDGKNSRDCFSPKSSQTEVLCSQPVECRVVLIVVTKLLQQSFYSSQESYALMKGVCHHT